jgi:hypothetical protein
MRYFGAISRALRRPATARTDRVRGGRGKKEGSQGWREKNRGACDDEKAHTGIPRINNNVD